MGFESPNQPNRTERLHSVPPREFASLSKHEQDSLAAETYNELRVFLHSAGFVEQKDVTEMYKHLSAEKLIVRREDPEAIEDLIQNGTYTITQDKDHRPNSVEWSPSDNAQGLRSAYLEGRGQKNSLVAIVGIRESEDLSIDIPPPPSQRTTEREDAEVRSVSGPVDTEDVVFVSVRIPLLHIPESELTEDELDQLTALQTTPKDADPVFIHRGFVKRSALH